MRMLDLIMKKRNGQSLTPEEINFIIKEYNEGTIPDYQIAAFLMAVYFQGLNTKETNALTASLVKSGEALDFSSLGDTVVDKHSSGGVGDKVTLIFAPLIAAAGVPVAKISGRGLDFTGGTIDKLESIPGFAANLSVEKFINLVKENNLAIMVQSESLTPAEGKLYALRDATGTVEDVSLISASIMSKKIAAGASAILLDVKTGQGAFMQSKEEAFHLAETLVRIGKDMDRKTVSVVTDMEQPLGYAVGNALEVEEAVKVLKGEGPRDVEELCLLLGGYMLRLVNKVRNPEEGQRQLYKLLKNGAAFEKLKQMVSAQGGDAEYLEDTSLLPRAELIKSFNAPGGGYLSEINARRIGRAAVLLGAGRSYKCEEIDHSVGVILTHKVGDTIEKDEPLAYLYGNSEKSLEIAFKELDNAFTISDEAVEPPPLLYGTVPPFPS